MNQLGANGEVHFHEQDCASVFVEFSAPPQDAPPLELLLLAAFSTRQMFCLGQEYGSLLAQGLLIIPDCMDGIVAGTTLNDVTLIQFPGNKGRKRFELTLRIRDDRCAFTQKVKGFGLFGRGVNFYAPMSVFAMIRHLASRRSDDGTFLEQLGLIAHGCGRAYLQGGIGPRNNTEVAAGITDYVLTTT